MVYSSWKLAHHWEKIEDIKKGKQPTPISLKIVLTNSCKRSCHFCFEKEKNRIFNDTLDTELVLKLFSDAKKMGIKSIEFTGGGEPTDHPEFERIILHAQHLGFDVGLTTNGTNLPNMNLSVLENITWLRISINAMSDEVYKRTCGINFNYRDMLKEVGKLKAHVGASFVVTSRNYHEIFDFTQYVKSFGFKNVRFTPARDDFSIISDSKEIWDECLPLLKKAKELEDANFKVYEFSERIKTLDTITKDFNQCYYQHLVVTVWTNGDLIPCVEVRGYEGTKLGNLYEESLIEIWKNKKTFHIDDCKIGCLHETKNMFIDYSILKEPKHINFI